MLCHQLGKRFPANFAIYIERDEARNAAHDEANRFKTGDLVSIEECRPISKRKRWVVVVEGASAPAVA